MQTLIVRIEGPSSEGDAFTVRGLSASSPGSGEVQHALGRIPAPLPAIVADGRELDAVAAIREVLFTTGDPPVPPEQVGRYLWRLLAATPVGAWWQRSVEVAEAGTVRTLLDVQATALQSLPWELLTCEPDGLRPFLLPGKPWARASGSGRDTDDLLVPVRMLVVVGDPQDPSLRVADEFDAIVGALREVTGHWHVELLSKPDPATLRSVLEDFRPHVLHVIAHGALDEASDSVVLVMPLEDGKEPWELTTSDVADLLSQPPRLVVLNACRSGTTGDDPTVPWSFTDAFLRHGCSAVVTMQGNIPSKAAIPFSAAFYREVAIGSGVDVAAARGRQAAYDALRGDRSDQRSWALPSLYLSTAPDRVLPVRLAVSNPVQEPPYRAAYEPVGTYVDRTRERWELLNAVDPVAGPPRQNLFVVAGQAKVGKSAVVRSALLTCHLRGRQVVYVDLDRRARARWLGMLRYVRDELTTWLPGAVEPMRRFDHDLAFLGERRRPSPYDPRSARQDDGSDFDFGSEDYQKWACDIFASFRTALQAIAEPKPLLLALDHLSKIYPPDLGDFVVPELLAPLGSGRLPGVHVVIVGTNEWLEELRSTAPTLLLPTPIRVPMFSWRKIEGMGREFVARQNRLPVNDRVIQILHAMRDTQPPEFTGDALQVTLKTIKLVS